MRRFMLIPVLAFLVPVGTACVDEGFVTCAAVPTPPRNVVVRSTESDEAILTWDSNGRQAVYWSVTPGLPHGNASAVGGVSSPFRHTGLSPGVTYYYVVCQSMCRRTAYSVEVQIQPIMAPTGVAATAGSDENIIGWDVVLGATSYNIYWDTRPFIAKSTGNLIAGVTAPFAHPVLLRGAPHYYVVTALNDVGGGAESSISFEVSATVPILGVPDPTFGAGGIVSHHDAAGGAGDDRGHDLLVDPVHRIIVAGESDNVRPDKDLVVWRFLDDGALDPSFGIQGWISHDDAAGGQSDDGGHSIAASPGGRILVAGESRNTALVPEMVVWAVDPIGFLDVAFGGQGWTVQGAAAGGSGPDVGWDLVEVGAGRVVVAGASQSPADSDLALWRVTGDGGLDASFAGAGFVTHDGAAGAGDDIGYAVAVDKSGRILVAGSSQGGADRDLALWRYEADGDLDVTFGGQGWVTHADAAGAPGDDMGRDIAVTESGAILVVGHSLGSNVDLALWRFRDTGLLDTSFATWGVAIHDGAGGASGDEFGLGVALDGTGSIWVAGYGVTAAGDMDMILWRYLPGGTPDTNFGNSGWISSDGAAGTPGGDDVGRSVAVDRRGRIVVVGEGTGSSSRTQDLVLWRYR